MTIGAVILLHYPDRDEINARKIIDAIKGSTRRPDKIVAFIDNPKIKFDDSEIIIIRSSHGFPVIARNSIGTLLDTDFVFYQDSDLCVEPRTIEYLSDYATTYPLSVLGFDGSLMAETPHPYTDGEQIQNVPEPTETDMLIRTWFVPRMVVGMSINLFIQANGQIPDKYADDILLCMGNRYGFRQPNFVLPMRQGAGVIEIGEHEQGQFYQPAHFETRNQVCRYLMNNRYDPTD